MTPKHVLLTVIITISYLIIKDRLSKSFFTPLQPTTPTRAGVVSYNIQYLPWKTKILSGVKPILNGYPIIMLQECFNRLTTLPLQSIFPEYYICRAKIQNFALVNSGLVILSQYPILSHEFIPFEKMNLFSADALSDKGFLSAEIQLPERRIRVIDTHLQSCDHASYDPIVKDQISQLIAYANALTTPYIIGGDFNINYTELSYNTIKAPSEPTIYSDLKSGDSVSHHKPGYIGFTFDYFFVHPSIQTEPVQTYSSSYSDHNPVFLPF
jgi:endonuclease/exonuclease/phosphatase family metal-dependent hydrolase